MPSDITPFEYLEHLGGTLGYLTELQISGLGGDSTSRHFEFRNGVNVIFGDNGGGKTTMLRTLYSALRNEASIIEDTPVTEAAVSFYSQNYETVLTRVLNRITSKASSDQKPLVFEQDSSEQDSPTVTKLEWACTTEGPWSDRTYSSHFLPVSRLYQAALERRFRGYFSPTDAARDLDNPAKTEASLEATFVLKFNQRWSEFTSSLLAEVQRIQQEGIASILQTVMLHRPGQDTAPPGDPDAAYDLATTFFARQPELRALPQKKHEFVNLYQGNPALRAVIRNIDSVEQKIKEAQRQRNFLNESLNSLFKGKTVLLSDSGINIVDKWGNPLKLESLSTGEKQVLILFLEALTIGNGVLIIDEPEISLHIEWQRRILATLHLLAPQAQIVAATHAPEIMADLDDDSIFRI